MSLASDRQTLPERHFSLKAIRSMIIANTNGVPAMHTLKQSVF